MAWRLDCQFAGLTFRPTLQETPSVSSSANLWQPRTAARSATVSFLDEVGIARLVSNGYAPQSGLASLYYNDVLIIQGNWSEIEFGPIGAPVSFTVSESVKEAASIITASGAVLRALTEDELGSGTVDPVVVGNRKPQDFNGFNRGVPKATTAIWSSVSRVAEGRIYPFIIGAPGSANHPGSPALYVDIAVGADKFLIAGHEVNCSTVTLWGPGPEGELTSSGGVALPVNHAKDLEGRLVAYVLGSDLTSTQNTTDTDNKVVLGSGIQLDPSAEYFVSWTGGEATPSGAGDALLLLLGLSTLHVDFGAWHAIRQRLNAYLIAGYVDAEVQPSALALNTIAQVLPVSAEYGVNGLRPVFWPWMDDLEATTASVHLICGTRNPSTGEVGLGFQSYLAGGVSFTNDSSLAVYEIEFGYDPDSSNYTSAETVTPSDSAYAFHAMSKLGYLPTSQKQQTRYVEDAATAASLAGLQMRAHCMPRRILRLLCDVEVYGPGTDQELYCGQPVLVSVPSLHMEAEPAFISALGWRGTVLDVTVEVRDDALYQARSGYVAPPPPPSVDASFLAAEDDGLTDSAAILSSDSGATWSSVSGLPADGTLEGVGYDSDNERFLAVGRGGAALFISKDGATVVDISIGGTANRYGTTYRPSADSGGALYVVVGNAGTYHHSTDGTSWTQVTSVFGSIGLYAALYHGGNFYVVGNSGRAWWSASGTGSFTQVNTTGTRRNKGICWSGTNIVVCRRSGLIAYGTPSAVQGGTWTQPTSGVSVNLEGIASDGSGTVVAVGLSGTVIRSADHGATWSGETSGTTEHLRGIAYGSSTWVAVGDSGTIITSTDGSSWSVVTSGTSNELPAIGVAP